MELFVVGGAVRDALLGLPATDRDWVAVGATPDELVAQGYRPVGRDFPVFLHPQTGEEVALARTERKSGRGYRGFTFHASPEVTLEEDLARRDLTINAMARDAHGRLIDPFGGERDLRAGVLRHVSPAFAEDPVRLLRVARFAARFHRFTIAPETQAMLRRLVLAGEVDALVPERVWQEISRGLMEARPSRMLDVLAESGAWPRLAPGLGDASANGPQLDCAAAHGLALAARYALLMRGEATQQKVSEGWRVPADCSAMAQLLDRCSASLQAAHASGPGALVTLLDRADAWRRPERFELMLQASQCLAPPPQLERLRKAWQAAAAVDTAAIAARAAAGPQAGAAIRDARIAAVAAAVK